MRITYTAQEMYEHIRSYDIIEFWGSRNEENVCMIKVKSSCVALKKASDTATSVSNASLIQNRTFFVAAATLQATCSLVKLRGGKSRSALLLHPIVQRSQSHFF